MNTDLLNAVKRAVAARGESILSEPDLQVISAFISDLAKYVEDKEKDVLKECLKLKFAQTLRNADKAERANCKHSLVEKLHKDKGRDFGLCKNTIELLATVLYGEEYGEENPPLPKGDYDRVIEECNAALRIKPDDHEALYNRGNAYYDKGYNYDRAIEDFDAAQSNYDRAIEDYNAALRIKPDYHEALYWRGVMYADNRNYDRAIEDYNAALRIKPDYHKALYSRCAAYANKGNYDRAIEEVEALLRIKPDYHRALNVRGFAYCRKGNYDRAIEDFEALLRIDPNDGFSNRLLRISKAKKSEGLKKNLCHSGAKPC